MAIPAQKIYHAALMGIALATVSASCKTSNFQWADNPVEAVTKAPAADPLPPADEAKHPTPEKSPDIPPTADSGPTGPLAMEERFTQLGKQGEADILIVIDDSPSMAEEQVNLSGKLSDLLSEVKDADWQIGVITTSVRIVNGIDSCQMTLIRPTDVAFEDKFRIAVQPGISGSDNEEGIRQAVNGLRCIQRPWVRPSSSLAVLIVSDADNCDENGALCWKQPSNTEDYLIHYVENDMRRVVGKTAGFYGIFGIPGEACTSVEKEGVQYQKLVNYNANGQMNYGSICDASYKQTLQRISKNIALLLNDQIKLKATPDAGSVVVKGKKADGSAIIAADYVLIGRTLTFAKGNEPALHSETVVNYKVTPP